MPWTIAEILRAKAGIRTKAATVSDVFLVRPADLQRLENCAAHYWHQKYQLRLPRGPKDEMNTYDLCTSYRHPIHTGKCCHEASFCEDLKPGDAGVGMPWPCVPSSFPAAQPRAGSGTFSTFSVSWLTSASTLAIRSFSSRLLSREVEISSGSSWLMHLVPRRLHLIQLPLAAESNMHLILRRLHSQQLRVPLRTLLRPASAAASFSRALAEAF